MVMGPVPGVGRSGWSLHVLTVCVGSLQLPPTLSVCAKTILSVRGPAMNCPTLRLY